MPSAARKCHGSVVGSASACATQAASHATVPSVRFFGWKMPLLLRVWGRRTTGGGGAGAAIPEEPLSISGKEDAPAGESTGASGGTVRVGEDRPGVIGVDGPGDEDSVTCEASGSGEALRVQPARPTAPQVRPAQATARPLTPATWSPRRILVHGACTRDRRRGQAG